jgi:putative aldouronate transport system permease protein
MRGRERTGGAISKPLEPLLLLRAQESFGERFRRRFRRDLPLYLMAVPGLLNLAVFKFLPMYGVIIAFQQYNPALGIFGSRWVGFQHFVRFFNDPYCYRILRNTLVLGFYSLVFGFPAPIILALLLNEVRFSGAKRVMQTVSYMPHFLSTVIVVGLLIDLTSLSQGKVNDLIALFGGTRINFMGRPEWFRLLYVSSGIWQGVGFGSIIYLAALSGVNPELYEAAIIDGANRWQQMVNITIPCIMPTVTILLILAVGGIVGNDFQKIFLMYNPSTYETADVVSTYVYRAGIEGASFSYSSAVGLFLAAIAFVFLFVTNKIAKTASTFSLW